MKSTSNKRRRGDDILDKSIQQQERKDTILADDELIQQRQEKLTKKWKKIVSVWKSYAIDLNHVNALLNSGRKALDWNLNQLNRYKGPEMREIEIVLAFRVNLNAMTIPNEAVTTKPKTLKVQTIEREQKEFLDFHSEAIVGFYVSQIIF